jgi:hypothetical protein
MTDSDSAFAGLRASLKCRAVKRKSAATVEAEAVYSGATMNPVVAFLLNLLALYGAIGAVTAVAFVTFGVTRVQPASVSPGARILLLPGALALWPYVLVRWLKAKAP